ncbi:hypothetical protein ACOSQ3_017201 [Xanthoceras sorbifolium]
MEPFQPILDNYPLTLDGKYSRRFQQSWFQRFPWLEYSISKDKAFCFPCFLFDTFPLKHRTFTMDSFQSWKRINCKGKCPFWKHEGGHNSIHMFAIQSWSNLKDPSRHIDTVMSTVSLQETLQNRLRLKTSLETVKWLAMQGCVFRGHDESINSTNRGNFIEMIKLQARVNQEIAGIVLENAPQNAKYTSPRIQKKLLNILANKVRGKIREEVGDTKICILVDEAVDESNKEQMAIIFENIFFQVMSVNDTNSSTLKREICNVLARYNLSVENLRNQGYDGASNMRGEWNGLQVLFLKDCPSAYYIHCFAHRLQLALIAVARKVHDIWLFCSKLNSIVNFVNASFKRHSKLKSIRKDEVKDLITLGELETATRANQICTLQRPGATLSTLLENLINKGLNSNIRGEAKALQSKSQDILNAMNLVSTTKMLLLELRENGWDTFLESVLNSRFPEQTIELLTLTMALSPVDEFKSFDVDDICTLAAKFYSQDFDKNDIEDLRRQLSHYRFNVLCNPTFQNFASLSELCQGLAATRRSEHYTLIDKLIRLVLTLPVSTVTTEQAFSAMKLLKTPLRNKMDDDFLTDCIVIYIEKEIADTIDLEHIICNTPPPPPTRPGRTDPGSATRTFKIFQNFILHFKIIVSP